MYRVLIICVFMCLSFRVKLPNIIQMAMRSEAEFKNNLMHGKAVYYHAMGINNLKQHITMGN